MKSDSQEFEKELPPGRYGKVLVLPPTGPGNPTDEEQTWPVVDAKPSRNIIFFDGPPEVGNATDEELTWPILDESSVKPFEAPPSFDVYTNEIPALGLNSTQIKPASQSSE
jgi:hypothetical protein